MFKISKNAAINGTQLGSSYSYLTGRKAVDRPNVTAMALNSSSAFDQFNDFNLSSVKNQLEALILGADLPARVLNEKQKQETLQ